jgi:hypothetical protein
MTVRALVVIALLAVLTACGSSSVQLAETGVDTLVVPTPSPDPDDFVRGVDNPWLPLPPGRTWTYQVVDVDGAHERTVAVADGPEVDGVPTTARVTTDADVTDGMRALATTPVGEWTGESAFSTVPDTSITCAPARRKRSTTALSFSVGGPQIAIVSTATRASAASPSRCQPSSSINGPAPRARSRNSFTMGC